MNAVLPLWPDGAPGSEGWSQQEQETLASPPIGIRVVRNVTRPSLTAYLPEPALATGAAVIVCPGGAFHFLAIEHEGTEVARWLNARGVAAFVLRYRLIETAVDEAEFVQQMQQTMADRDAFRRRLQVLHPLVVADGLQAIKLVRRRAAEWGVVPNRIGIMGFSAGGSVTAGVALEYDADSRPDFAAPIYSAPREAIRVPADAPPLFIAAANDDGFSASACVPLYSAWNAAGRSAELHIYAKGGHGFGMNSQGLPSDGWIDRFGEWLKALGVLEPRREGSTAMAAVEIVPYDERWPDEFAAIGAALRDALGALALRIDHIGSTSVPGLAAKDRIDIQLTVADFERFEPVQAALERLGYTLAPRLQRDHEPPGWEGPAAQWEKRFFRPPLGQRPTNLHVRAAGRANQRYPLLFRDYLRAHPRSAAAYAELKRRLADHLRDLDSYPDVKDPACDLIAAAAEDWAVAVDWEQGPSDA